MSFKQIYTYIMNLDNIPGPAKKLILRNLNVQNLARLLKTSSIKCKNQNIRNELNVKKIEMIRRQMRKNEAVVHDKSNHSFNRVNAQIDDNCYKVGDIVLFESWRGEYGIGVVSFNKNKMKKKLVSNEGLSYVSDHIPNYVKEYIKEMKYDNVESVLRNRHGLNRNVKLYVKNNILGTPYNLRS